MDDAPTGEQAKELYAYFGLAFYLSNVLEHGIVNALCLLELLNQRRRCGTQEEWECLVDHYFDDSFTRTFGRLKDCLRRHEEAVTELNSLMPELEECLKERNFLAHHFWRAHAEHWFTARGRAKMVQRLEGARDRFAATTARLDEVMQPIADRYGLTPDVQRQEFERMKREALSEDG